jgi:hypothetical protein
MQKEFVLGIGTPKKWKGIIAVSKNDDYLWTLNYKEVKGIIQNPYLKPTIVPFTYIISGGLTTTGREINSDSKEMRDVACIYDNKGNLNILFINKIDNLKYNYTLGGKYRLSEAPPDWSKINVLGELVWEYSKMKSEEKMQRSRA